MRQKLRTTGVCECFFFMLTRSKAQSIPAMLCLKCIRDGFLLSFLLSASSDIILHDDMLAFMAENDVRPIQHRLCGLMVLAFGFAQLHESGSYHLGGLAVLPTLDPAALSQRHISLHFSLAFLFALLAPNLLLSYVQTFLVKLFGRLAQQRRHSPQVAAAISSLHRYARICSSGGTFMNHVGLEQSCQQSLIEAKSTSEKSFVAASCFISLVRHVIVSPF